MNAVVGATCLLVAGLSWLLYGSELTSLLPFLSFADTSMPESAAAPRLSPQGVPYRDLPHIVNADGQHLFCRYWEPDSTPRALAFISHGAAEHTGPYDEIGQKLKEMSVLAFGHDHVGHGQSEGGRLEIKDFHIFVRDLLQHVDLMKSRHPGLPVFIVGHSMGGAISILSACERQSDFAGLVLIGPLVNVSAEMATPFKVFVVKVMSVLAPNLPIGSIESKLVSREPKAVAQFESDELVYKGRMRVSFGMQLMAACASISEKMSSMTFPFYILHGSDDKLCDIEGSKSLHEKAASKDKKIKIYEGAYHVLHHELPEVSESVLKEITSWISERIPA
ncbi:monoglyceride lipase isoform 1-T1 [Synchiropus picturatus]